MERLIKASEEPGQKVIMRSLVLYQDYTRQEIHDIFAPNVPFTPQSGTWGLHGIIAIPDRPKDFLFFVTFGQQQGTRVFDEGITDTGVLSGNPSPAKASATLKSNSSSVMTR